MRYDLKTEKFVELSLADAKYCTSLCEGAYSATDCPDFTDNKYFNQMWHGLEVNVANPTYEELVFHFLSGLSYASSLFFRDYVSKVPDHKYY